MTSRFERRHALSQQRQKSRSAKRRSEKKISTGAVETPSNGARARPSVEFRQGDPERQAEAPAPEAEAEAPGEDATPLPPAAEVAEDTAHAQQVAELEGKLVFQQQQIEKWKSMQTKTHAPPGFKLVEMKLDATSRGPTNDKGEPISIGRVIRYAARHEESDWVSKQHLDPAGAVKAAWEQALLMATEALSAKVAKLEGQLKRIRRGAKAKPNGDKGDKGGKGGKGGK